VNVPKSRKEHEGQVEMYVKAPWKESQDRQVTSPPSPSVYKFMTGNTQQWLGVDSL